MSCIKKIIALAISCSMVFLLLSSCNSKDSSKKVVRLSEVTHSVFYAPLYVAINNGYFEEEGIEIELSTGEGADKVMTAVLSGSVDIGFAGPEAAIYVYNEGRDNYAEVFAQLTKKDGSFLMARNYDNEFKWDDLKGSHVLPGRKGGMPYMTFKYVLKQNNIDTENDLFLDDTIKFDLMAGAFTSGTGDYFTCFEPVASTIEKEGKGYIVASVGEAGGELPYTAFFANKNYIQNNEELIQKFVNAIYKGQKFVHENSSEEIVKAISNSFIDSDHDMLIKVVENYKKIDSWSQTPAISEEAFERLQDIMEYSGELEKRVEFEKIINNKFAESSINNLK